MSLTKKTKPSADYHIWQATELVDNDIIDVYTSLGNRPANQVTINSANGNTVYKLNVAHKIYQNQSVQNPWIPFGASFNNPVLIDEIEQTKDSITISSGEIHIYDNDLAIEDIKIVTLGSGLIIEVN